MQVKVIESFVDIHTRNLHPEGEIFEVNEQRLAEIQKNGGQVQVIPAPVASSEENSKDQDKKKGMKKDV